MRTILRHLFVLILGFQIVVSPAVLSDGPVAVPSPPRGSIDTGQEDWHDSPFAELITSNLDDPSVRETAKRFEQMTAAFETGDLSELDPSKFDTFHLRSQFLETYEYNALGEATVRRYDLSQLNLALPAIPFAPLQVSFDSEKGELYFDAIVAGRLAARHIIADLDIVGVGHDAELLHFVDSQGNLHAMDMALNSEIAFKSPLPIHRRIYSAPQGFEFPEGRPEIVYLSRAKEPFAEYDDPEFKGVLPRDADGSLMLTAGDCAVYTRGTSGEKHLVGVFNRVVTHEILGRGTRLLAWLAFVVSPESFDPQMLDRISGALNDEGLERDAYLEQKGMHPGVRDAILSLSATQMEQVLGRIQENVRLGERDFDRFTVEEVVQKVRKLRSDAEAEAADLAESKKRRDQERREELQAQIDRGDFTKDLLPTGVATEEFAEDRTEAKPVYRSLLERSTAPLIKLGAIATVVTTAGIYAWGTGNLEFLGEAPVSVVAWSNYLYDIFWPDVVRTAEYRLPLILSMTAQMSTLVFCPLIAKMAVPALDFASRQLNGLLIWKGDWFGIPKALRDPIARFSSNSVRTVGAVLSETADRWRPHDAWRRVITLGFRITAFFIYPLFNRICVQILRQPNLLEAIKNGQNPFLTVEPGSELARKIERSSAELAQSRGVDPDGTLKIERPFRLGTSGLDPRNLLGTGQRELVDLQNRAMTEIAAHDAKVRNIAWVLAAAIVSQEEGIDPATLILVGSGQLDVEQLQRLASDPAFYAKCRRAAEAFHLTLRELPAMGFGADLENLDPTAIIESYTAAKAAAEKLKRNSRLQNILFDLGIKFRDSWRTLRAGAIDFAKSDVLFLRSAVANSFVRSNVLSQMKLDQTWAVGVTGLTGEFADTNHPENLSFNTGHPIGSWSAAKMGWTNSTVGYGFLTSIFIPYYIRFGSRLALVLQGKPVVEETIYRPVETADPTQDGRTENFFAGMFQFIKELSYLPESGLGDYTIRSAIRQLTNIQMGLIINLVTLTLITHSNFEDSFRNYLVMFAGADLAFAWPWGLIQVGLDRQAARISRWNERLESALVKISQGTRFDDKAQRNEGYHDLMSILFEHTEGRTLIKGLERSLFVDAEKLLNLPAKADNLLSQDREFLSQSFRVLDLTRTLVRLQRDKEKADARGDLEESARLAEEIQKFEADRASSHDYTGMVMTLALALQSGDRDKTEQAYTELREAYAGAVDPETLSKMSPGLLLQFAAKNPPHPSRPSKWIQLIAIAVGAFTTTVMGNTFFSKIINDHAYSTYADVWPLFAMYGVYLGVNVMLMRRPAKTLLAEFRKARRNGFGSWADDLVSRAKSWWKVQKDKTAPGEAALTESATNGKVKRDSTSTPTRSKWERPGNQSTRGPSPTPVPIKPTSCRLLFGLAS